MSAKSVLAQVIALLASDGGTSPFNRRDYWANDWDVDKWRTGTIEVDIRQSYSRERAVDQAYLVYVVHRFEARITRVTAGNPATARNAVLDMVEAVKKALSTARGDLGHDKVRRNSLIFNEARFPPDAQDQNLNKRTGYLLFECEEFQVASTRA